MSDFVYFPNNYRVAEPDLLKQGLKLMRMSDPLLSWSLVAEPDLLKQGLKRSNYARNVYLHHVAEPDLLKQGLKLPVLFFWVILECMLQNPIY